MVNRIDSVLNSKPTIDSVLNHVTVPDASVPAGSALSNFFKGGAQGLDNLARGALVGGENLVNSVLPANYQIPLPPPINAFKSDPQDADTLSSDIGNVAGQTLGALGLGPESVGTGLLGKIGGSALTGASLGALNSQNQNSSLSDTAKNALLGALTGGGLTAVLHPIAGVVTNMAKRGSVSPEEAANTVKVANQHNITPDVGTLTNDPLLRDIYNFSLPSMPFSGVPENQQNTLSKITNLTANTLNNLKGDTPIGDIPNALAQSVKSNGQQATSANKKLFNTVFQQADKNNTISANQLPNLAATIRNSFSLTRSPLTILPDLPRDLRDQMDHLQAYNPEKDAQLVPDFGSTIDNIDSENSNPSVQGLLPNRDKSVGPTYSFSNIHTLQSKLGNLSRKAYQNGDYLSGSLYGNLAKATNQDLTNNMAQLDPDLNSQYLNAKQDFAQNVLPYRNSSISNIINNNGNPSSLPQALTQVQNQKIYQDLSQGDKDKVLFSQLKRNANLTPDADIYYSPGSVMNSIKNTLPQLPSYISQNPNTKPLQDLLSLRNLYNTANTNINSPATGFGAAKRALVNTAMLGSALTGMHYGLSMPELLTAGAGLAGLGRLGAKALTSPLLVNSYLKGSNSGLLNSLNLIPRVASNSVASTITTNRS